MATKKPNGLGVAVFEPVPAKLVLKHPATDEPIPDMWMEVVGPESDEYRAALRKLARQDVGRKPHEDEIEEAEYKTDQSLSLLAACVTGWNEDEFGPFDKERTKELLKKYPSLTRQIDEFVAEKKHFFRRLSG